LINFIINVYTILKNYKIEVYNHHQMENWNNFVSIAKNATFLFKRGFMDYHQDRFEDASILIFEEENLIGVFPANRVGDTIFSHQGLSYGGIVISHKTKLNDYLIIVNELIKFYQKIGIQKLVVKQMPHFYCHQYADDWTYATFLMAATLSKVETSAVIDLSLPLNYNKDRKEGVKRGLKNQLVIKEVDQFEDFWENILKPNLNQRHGVNPVHSLDEISLLKSRFPKQIRQFNVYKNNQIVAGTTIFETDFVAHSQYISANDERSVLGSLDFLHDHLFKNVFNHKKYFDFGISNENNGKQLNQGLNYWKQSFGAQICANFVHEIDLTKNIELSKVLI